jgi:hypothetical protein
MLSTFSPISASFLWLRYRRIELTLDCPRTPQVAQQLCAFNRDARSSRMRSVSAIDALRMLRQRTMTDSDASERLLGPTLRVAAANPAVRAVEHMRPCHG